MQYGIHNSPASNRPISIANDVFFDTLHIGLGSRSAKDLMKFAETVANNRGVPVNLFATVAEAEAWLAGKLR